MQSGVNDNIPVGDGRVFRASAAALFGPVAAVLGFYASLYVAIVLTGHGNGALARLCLVTGGLAVPFLFSQAVLRWVTIRVQATGNALYLHRGFPSPEMQAVAWSDIRALSFRRPPLGIPRAAGTLRIELADGRTVAVADLEDAAAARDALMRMAFPEEEVLISEMTGVPQGLERPVRRAATGS